MCHDEMSAKFAYISRTSDFCALPQELMIKIIENINIFRCKVRTLFQDENCIFSEIQVYDFVF